MVKVTIFCDTVKTPKRCAMELYKYYLRLYNQKRDGTEFKPMMDLGRTKIFLPTSETDLLYLDFKDFVSPEYFKRRTSTMSNPTWVWRDINFEGNKRSLYELATDVAKIYYDYNNNTEDNDYDEEN